MNTTDTFRLFWVADDKQASLDCGRDYASEAAALAAIPDAAAELQRQGHDGSGFFEIDNANAESVAEAAWPAMNIGPATSTTPTLWNYEDGEYLRPASSEELAASIAAGDTGAILVDGRTCYVLESTAPPEHAAPPRRRFAELATAHNLHVRTLVAAEHIGRETLRGRTFHDPATAPALIASGWNLVDLDGAPDWTRAYR